MAEAVARRLAERRTAAAVLGLSRLVTDGVYAFDYEDKTKTAVLRAMGDIGPPAAGALEILARSRNRRVSSEAQAALDRARKPR